MSNASIIVNTRKIQASGNKVSQGNSSTAVNLHTVKAQDLYTMRAIPGQGGLSMVMKLEG